MKNLLARFARNQNGATAVEYGLICLLIAVAIIPAVMALTPKISAIYEMVGNAVPQS